MILAILLKNLECLKNFIHFSIEFGMKNVDVWLKIWYEIYIHKVHVKNTFLHHLIFLKNL